MINIMHLAYVGARDSRTDCNIVLMARSSCRCSGRSSKIFRISVSSNRDIISSESSFYDKKIQIKQPSNSCKSHLLNRREEYLLNQQSVVLLNCRL